MKLMELMDLIDTLLGPLDLISRGHAAARLAARGDRGVEFRIARIDKGGTHGGADTRTLLAEYGIKAHRTRFDANYLYFVVGSRQADWTRYLLQQAGVQVDAGKSRPAAGRMPRPWSRTQRKERY